MEANQETNQMIKIRELKLFKGIDKKNQDCFS